MPGDSPQINPYDQTPYPMRAYVTSLPHRTAAVARLFGLKPPDSRQCRVLELGCASGVNIIAMAEMMPESQFIGIDLSQRQIEQGNHLIAELGLTNIELRCQDICSLPREEDLFDYIVGHGVYSWIHAEAREALLKITKEKLRPSGIAYLSYNTYPGWHGRQMVREVMQYSTRGIATPAEQAKAARAIVKFLAESVAPEEPHAAMLKAELRTLDEINDSFALHDHLGTVNYPVYFHEFVRHAAEYGLSYLGESRAGLMWSEAFGPKVSAGLRAITSDLVEMEQYMDFLRNRMFRSSLLCHPEQKIDRSLTPNRLAGLFISASVAQQAPSKETPPGWTPFVIGNATMATSEPTVISVLQQLEAAAPRAIAFEELIETAKLDPSAVEAVGKQLMYFYMKGVIDLLAAPLPAVPVSERPRARKLARLQAKSGQAVSFRHENITLSPVAMVMLPLLDGTHNREFIIKELDRLVKADVLKLASPPASPEEQLKVLADAVDQTLKSLASHALLIE